MSRRIALLACLLGLSALLSVGMSQGQPDKKPAPVTMPTLDDMLAKLDMVIQTKELNDPALTLGQVLDELGKKYDLVFEFNTAAFVAEGVSEPYGVPLGEKPIRARARVRLGQYLQELLQPVSKSVPSGVIYLLRRDHIEITTTQFAAMQIWGQNTNAPRLPLVHGNFKQQLLEEVLAQLAERSEYNIVLDSKIPDVASARVSVRFMNTPLDTALQILAELTDLELVLRDNVAFLTSKERAAVLQEKFEPNPDNPDATTPRVGSGVGNSLGRGAAAGPAM